MFFEFCLINLLIVLFYLDAYQRVLELEKKKKTIIKKGYNGPIIRYHSVTMPSVKTDETEEGDENLVVEANDKQSRTFITFTDEQTLKQVFSNQKPKTVLRKQCVVTGLPAKYFDPITQYPYANLYAFKALREMHAAKLKAQAT